MANKESGGGGAYSIASRSRAESSTKTWLLTNLMSMLGLLLATFFVLGISFELKMHKHKSLAKEDLKLQHKLSALRNGVSSNVKREVAKHKKAKVFSWKAIEDQCSARGLRIDPFPDSFEPALYEEIYGAGRDYHHYIEVGRKEGFECTRGQRMKEVINMEILPKFIEAVRRDRGSVLEIGPFLNPMLVADEVKYFDVLDLEGLKERAKNVGYPEINPVKIDYVSATGDLSVIPESNSFTLVAGSNVLSHQVDLVRHMQQVGRLLKEGGYYAMTVRFFCLARLAIQYYPVRCYSHFSQNETLTHRRPAAFLLSGVGQALYVQPLPAGNEHFQCSGRLL